MQKNDDNNSGSNMGSEEAAIENFSYEENPRGGITITGLFDDRVTNIVIPEMIEGKRVTAIGEEVFLECSVLVSIELPSGVTKIEDSAFFGCYGVTITTHSGSYAETYTRKNGISVETH